VDHGPGRYLDRLARGGDVAGGDSRETADGRVLDLFRDFPHRVKVSLGRAGKSRFDNVHAQFLQFFGYPEFLSRVHGGSWGLFAVSQCGVENVYFVAHEVFSDKNKCQLHLKIISLSILIAKNSSLLVSVFDFKQTPREFCFGHSRGVNPRGVRNYHFLNASGGQILKIWTNGFWGEGVFSIAIVTIKNLFIKMVKRPFYHERKSILN
jgi:hypothetical protein